MDAYGDMRASLGLQGLDEVSRSSFKIFQISKFLAQDNDFPAF